MKKLIISILTILLFYACGTVKHTENEYEGEGDDIVGLLEVIDIDKMYESMKIGLSTRYYRFKANSNQGEYKYWQNGDWQSVPIATIEKQLYRHNGRIYDKDSGRIASYCNIIMYFNSDSIYHLAELNEFGIIKTFQIGWKKYSCATIDANCDSLGIITNIQYYVGGVRTREFKNGKGWWYDYYIFPPADGESIIDNETRLELNYTIKIKSKGRLKNNFKVGRWKYYDPQGRLIRTERFRLRDSIDIRFPYSMIPKK